jgi:hypothetical protein
MARVCGFVRKMVSHSHVGVECGEERGKFFFLDAGARAEEGSVGVCHSVRLECPSVCLSSIV